MRHQNRDIESHETQEDGVGTSIAKYVTVIGSLAAVGFLAVSTMTSTATTPSAVTNFAISSVRPEVPEYASLDETHQVKLFDEFADKFGRKYKNDNEKKLKFTNFQRFLQLVDHRNAKEKQKSHGKAHGGAIHGITKFADLSEDEFKKLLGYKATTPTDKSMRRTLSVPKYKGDTTSVDWTGTYTTAVKDQGYCGSCWAFSATSQIESDSIRAGLLTTDDTLSPEQIVQCDEKDYGCLGGNTETAYIYVKKAGGITTEAQYPYTSYWDVTGTCSTDYTAEVTVSSYTSLTGATADDDTATEDAMESYVLSTGPLSVCLDASEWSSYTSGIVTSCGTDVDHCVQAVGINTDDGYWIVRNSWGTSWGIDGFIYLETGSNTCDIAYDPTYVTPSSV